MSAEIIDALCQRYSCLPSALLAEDADLIFRMHQMIAEAHPEGDAESEMGMEQQLAGMSSAMPAEAIAGF